MIFPLPWLEIARYGKRGRSNIFHFMLVDPGQTRAKR